ncbi:uncharacterized protein LOC111637347 isoform X1 [Centruroides sculpturatus]|uniref:uncharacterized protein LOC111637347 isoform X1 n=1 Tax=Centruroides sculpturatus TaxID=218467 RepID=UPI000C6CD31C|nr:uncharacterized protein LOC111637347 isoform X1 [Centruroides sculpturatus]XP_023238593.1 uncharacterized protein LOC111637347 isoform X1 [Centruroides sculpturatus]
MDLRDRSKYFAWKYDRTPEEIFKSLVNAKMPMTSNIHADFPDQTESSSSDSDDEENDFCFLERRTDLFGFCENRPLKKEFEFLEKYSLVKDIISEENEDDDPMFKSSSKIIEEEKVLDETNNKDQSDDKIEKKQKLRDLVETEERKSINVRYSWEDKSTKEDENDRETTKCSDAFTYLFCKIPSFIFSCCRRRKKHANGEKGRKKIT